LDHVIAAALQTVAGLGDSVTEIVEQYVQLRALPASKRHIEVSVGDVLNFLALLVIRRDVADSINVWEPALQMQ